jgi:hypothetical protein
MALAKEKIKSKISNKETRQFKKCKQKNKNSLNDPHIMLRLHTTSSSQRNLKTPMTSNSMIQLFQQEGLRNNTLNQNDLSKSLSPLTVYSPLLNQ